MDKVRFPYRAAGHLALLHIVAESGSWKKQGLSVEYDSYVGPQEAHEVLRSGKAEFISGNHITPYIARAEGDDWIYLGQTANYVAHLINPSAKVFPGYSTNFVEEKKEKQAHPAPK